MLLTQPKLLTKLVYSVALLTFLWSTSIAKADGGFPDPSLIAVGTGVAASASWAGRADVAAAAKVTVTGNGLDLTSTTGAEANGGWLTALAGVWDLTTVKVVGAPANTKITANSNSEISRTCKRCKCIREGKSGNGHDGHNRRQDRFG